MRVAEHKPCPACGKWVELYPREMSPRDVVICPQCGRLARLELGRLVELTPAELEALPEELRAFASTLQAQSAEARRRRGLLLN